MDALDIYLAAENTIKNESKPSTAPWKRWHRLIYSAKNKYERAIQDRVGASKQYRQ